MTDDLPQIEASETALLVMDFQPGIVAMVDKSEELLERVKKAIAVARDKGATIGYVRVAFADEDLVSIPNTNKGFSSLASQRGAAMHADAPGTQIHEQLKPQAGDIVVRKVRVGAFSTTDLDQQLRAKGIKNLILAGISTSGVVLSTIRDGADKDYRVFVLKDGVADTDQETHRVLIEKIFPRQTHVITTDDLEKLLSN